jgi:four helix bundle protein
MHGGSEEIPGPDRLQLADQIRVLVFALTERECFRRDLKLYSQTEDAVNSMCRNIAEGFGCKHKEFARFLQISRRSLNELTDAFRSAQLKKYVTAREYESIWRLAHRLYPAYDRLIRTLLTTPDPPPPKPRSTNPRRLVPPTHRSLFKSSRRNIFPPTRRSILPPTRRSVLPPTRRSVLSPTGAAPSRPAALHRPRSTLAPTGSHPSPTRRSVLSPTRRSRLSPTRRSVLSPTRRSVLAPPQHLAPTAQHLSPTRPAASFHQPAHPSPTRQRPFTNPAQPL